MSTPQLRLVWLSFALLIALIAGGVAEGKPTKPTKKKDTDTGVAIENWLVLGPVSSPLPVFHDDASGGYALKDLLTAKPLTAAQARAPRTGDSIPWFGSDRLMWEGRAAGKRGLVLLDGDDPEGPATAWMAAYLDAPRWVELEIELTGDHPRRAWLDGEALVEGGQAAGDEVKGKLKLDRGKHRLLLQTVRDPERDAAWSVGATLSASAAMAGLVTTTVDPARQVDIVDITDAPQITDLAVSPDGREVVTLVRRFPAGENEKEAETWIELRGTTDGAAVESWRESSSVSSIDWSPDGRYLSWILADGGSDPPRSTLHLVDRETGVRAPLLDRVERLAGYAWSPDASSIAYWTTTKADQDERGVKRVGGLMDRWASFRDKQYLSLVSVPEGTRRRVTAGELSTSLAGFSPDGSRMLVTRQAEDFDRRPYSRTELWEIAVDDLQAKKLRDFGWLDAAEYSPDGKRILVATQPSEFGDSGLDVSPEQIANSYDTQLFIWTPATDEVDAIARDFDPAVNAATWSRRDGRIYLTATDRDRVGLFRYDSARRTFDAIDAGQEMVGRWDIAEHAGRVVALGSSVWEPPQLVAVDLDQGTFRRLQHPADAWFAEVGRGTVETWDFTSAHGRRVEGRVYLPPGFDAQRRYPAIVYYYGGTVPVSRSFGGRYPKEWWASQGYVVYVPQPSGATGFGQPASAAHVNDWGKTTSEEIIEGTRKFLDAHRYVDPQRVGCIGASYGGFMTMLLSTKTDVFRTAVAHAGISSISSYWGEGYWGYSYSSVATAESFPWNRPDLYVDQSPLFRADQARVPILLTHGRADTNVPVGESDAFFIALKLLGKQVEYVQVEGQDHWIVDRSKRILWSRTIVAWFDRWLKDQPEWWYDLYPDSKPKPDEADPAE